MGMEYKPTEKIGLQTEVQFPLYVWNFTNNEENYRSYQIRGETRYYYGYRPKENGGSVNYVAAEGFYIDKKFDLINDPVRYSHYINRAGEVKTFDKAAVQQQIWVVALKYGRIWGLGKRISLDFYTGLGIRFYNNRYQTVNETDYFLGDPKFGFYIDTREQEGKGKILPHLAVGLKVAYRIW